MLEPLGAFAPRRCLELRMFEPGSFVVQDATTLFVDVAGFTPLTDRLGSVGSRGTEELSQLLREFFGAVADTVMDRGGDPVTFGGDALTIVFDGQPASTLNAANGSAAAIQHLASCTAGTPTLAGPVSLKARVGIARGSVTTAIAGSARRSTPVLLGAGLDLAVAAELEAAPGQVKLHPSVSRSSEPRPLPRPRLVARASKSGRSDRDLLARLVNPLILGRLNEGRELLESHRSISVAFVRFPPVAEPDLPGFLSKVGELLELVDGFDGEVVQVAGGDKGTVAMVVFGAPVAHSDDPLRAVQAMLELRRLERMAAIGVATGPVFAALLGSAQRRFPAHSGQAVNVAARLMQAAAPGQLLTEGTTWRFSHRHLRQDGPVVRRMVKGRETPVETRAVVGWRRGRRRASEPGEAPLVGRQSELNSIEGFLDDVSASAGRVLVLSGTPGVGKSRLFQEAVQRATTRGLHVVLVDADDHPRGRSTAFWREIIGGVTGTSSRAASSTWLEVLTRSLPDAAAQLPVLGQLLGVRLGARVATQLPPELEAELVRNLVARLVKAAATKGPVLLAIENTHRLDRASQELLENLAWALPGFRAGLLVTRRTGEEDREAASSSSSTELLPVVGLTDAQVAQLAADSWRQSSGGSPPPWLPAVAGRRAGGNPLFVRTVTALLRENWNPGDPPPSESFLAGSLSGLIATQIDRLSVLPHQLLNVLAVARRPCTAVDAAALLSADVGVGTVSRTASELVAKGLVRIDTDAPTVRYGTQHEVLQQVVYEGLSHAERARLHRSMATYLADSGADATEVAEHVDRIGDRALGGRWFPMAARSARASWDFPGAVGWWRRALPLLAGPARDVAEVELLEVLLVAGRANEVLVCADDVLARKGGGSPSSFDGEAAFGARFSHAVAEAAWICGDLERSQAAATAAMHLTDAVDEARHQRAAELLVLVLSARGDFGIAIVSAERHLSRAERSGDAAAVTTAHAALGAALLLAGRPKDAATHYQEALSAAVTLGDVVRQIHVLSDLAGCAFETGSHADCVDLLARARELADKIGYRRHLAFNLNNEAQLRAALGDDHATACCASAVQRSLEMGDLANAANALHTWVTARPATAAEPAWWRRLWAIDARLERHSVAAADAAELAVAMARRGKSEDALRWAGQAAEAAQETDQPPVLRRATFARLVAELRATGSTDPATRAAFATGLDSLLEGDDLSDLERAEISLERWRATRSQADRDVAVALLNEAFAAEPSTLVRSWLADIGAPTPKPPNALLPPVGIGRARTTRAQLLAAFDRLDAVLGQSSVA